MADVDYCGCCGGEAAAAPLGEHAGCCIEQHDIDPVCGRCKLPAAWVNGHWVHAEIADAAICELLFRGIDA